MNSEHKIYEKDGVEWHVEPYNGRSGDVAVRMSLGGREIPVVIIPHDVLPKLAEALQKMVQAKEAGDGSE